MKKRFQDHKQFRLPHFNYSSTGLYYITICTRNKVRYFGRIKNGEMVTSAIGIIAEECWMLIPEISSFASLDQFIIMPDHIHGIIHIDNPDEDSFLKKKEFRIRPRSISTVISGFKSAVTRRCRAIDPDLNIWQSRFFDRIIRNECELNNVRRYIINNPIRWEKDQHQRGI